MPSIAALAGTPASAAIVGATSTFDTTPLTVPPAVHGLRTAKGIRIDGSYGTSLPSHRCSPNA